MEFGGFFCFVLSKFNTSDTVKESQKLANSTKITIEAWKLVWYCSMGKGRKHQTSKSETKDCISHGRSGAGNGIAWLQWFHIPRGQVEVHGITCQGSLKTPELRESVVSTASSEEGQGCLLEGAQPRWKESQCAVSATLSRANGPCKRVVSAPRRASHVARGIRAEGANRRRKSIILRRHNSNKQDFKML